MRQDFSSKFFQIPFTISAYFNFNSHFIRFRDFFNVLFSFSIKVIESNGGLKKGNIMDISDLVKPKNMSIWSSVDQNAKLPNPLVKHQRCQKGQ